MKIDLGDPMRVRGVVIQGRDSSQYVTEVEVQHSLHPNSGSSGLQWQANGGVRAFPTATYNQKSELLFMEPVVARYIKIVVWGWNKYISMRAGVLVDEPAVSCSECPVNTYNAYTGATVCTDCPPSTSSVKIKASSSLVCKCTFSATRSCRSCPANQYGLGPSDRKVGTLMPRGWTHGAVVATAPDGTRTTSTSAFQPNDIDMTYPLPGNIAVITNWGNGQVLYMNISTGDITPVNWGGHGFEIGAASKAKLNYPDAAVVSPDGSMILVAVSGVGRVMKIALPNGTVSVFAGAPAELGCCNQPSNKCCNHINRDGNRTFARFQFPSDVAFHPDGNRIFVASRRDEWLNMDYIRLIDLAADHVSTINVYARTLAMTEDGSTLVFTIDDRIRSMDLTQSGSYPVRDVAGNVNTGYADGVGTAAKFRSPCGITITPDGVTAFVVEEMNSAIRSVDMKTGAVSTLAGSGTQPGYLDGYGPAARFSQGRAGLALTPDGSMLLMAESGSNRCSGHPAPFSCVPQYTRCSRS
jgi:hypothetical protein